MLYSFVIHKILDKTEKRSFIVIIINILIIINNLTIINILDVLQEEDNKICLDKEVDLDEQTDLCEKIAGNISDEDDVPQISATLESSNSPVVNLKSTLPILVADYESESNGKYINFNTC